MKIILILSFLIASLFGTLIEQPLLSLESSGAVTDMVALKDKLYSATDASCVDVFDLKTKKMIQKIEIEKIKDFMGDIVDAKVFSVDVLNNKLLILSQGTQGYRRVYIYANDALKLVIPDSLSLSIAKAKFLDKDTILLALLSDELISYDITKQKQNYRVQASNSKFSNFALNEKKTQVVVSDESGNLQLMNTKDGSLIKTYKGQNLDDVFQVDYKNGIIATAGKDRRVVIYDTKTDSAYYESSSFFIYSVGLSPSGKLVGYASDVNNNVTVFNTKTKKTLGVFGGNKITLSNILFLNEKEFLVSSDDEIINLYKLK